MKKILLFSLDKRDTTSFWRAVVIKYIQNKDFEITDISDTKVFDWSVFIGYDMLIMQRPFGTEHGQVLMAAKSMGLKIILDYDDNLLNVGQDNPTFTLYRDNLRNTIACLKTADEIWVSTQSIKDEYLVHNPNIYVIPNAHNDYLFKLENKKSFTANKKVYYRGGGSHQGDVASMSDMLVSVINNHTDYTFTFMGDRFAYLESKCDDNYHIVGGMTIMEYFRFIHHENPSVFIFPLVDSIFNRGKSCISWIEATFCGAEFYGNKALPEFNREFITDLSEFPARIKDGFDGKNNALSWEYICDNLLLSNINKIREERILANL